MRSLGLFFALLAFFSWGFGDFFIQRTVRAIGTWKSLFLICVVTTIVLTPLLYQDIVAVFSSQDALLLLSLAASAGLIMSFFDFEAFKTGKLAIVEPIISFELPLTIAFAIFFRYERLEWVQLVLAFVVFCGILLAITIRESDLHYHRRILERGVLLAIVAAVGSALSNFFVGAASQDISPLVTVWFVHTFLMLASLGVLLARRDFRSLASDIRRQYAIVVPEVVFDNAGWLSFAAATVYLPIAITTTISESYIALAVVLGIFITKEKLQRHQLIGVVLAVLAVILLSVSLMRP